MGALLFLALSAYAGAYLLALLARSAAGSLEGAAASDAVSLRGIALRRERLCAVSLSAQDGERLPAARTGGAGSAVFFAACDGFEDLGPELLEDLTAETLSALLAREPMPPEDAAGRLVLDGVWYFAAFADDAAPLRPGACRVCFAGSGELLPARLLQVRKAEGQRLVLLRLTAGGEYLTIRKTTALLYCAATES